MIYDYGQIYSNDNEKFLKQSLVRAGALVTTISLSITATLLILDIKMVALLLLIIQLSVFLNSSSYNLYTPLVQFVQKFFISKKDFHTFEVRFQGAIGALFIILALLSLFINNFISLFFVFSCLFASQLNAFFGICIACKIYPRYLLIKNKLLSKNK
jgi:hypothetical protein